MFDWKKPASPPGAGRKWLPLALVGVVAVVAGILLPQMLGGVAPPPEAAAPAADVQKGSLDYTPPTWPEAPDSRAMLTRLGVGTAVVLVLCVAMLIIGRRWLRRLPGPTGLATRMALVETLPLGGQCRVQLVRVGKQQVLVGLDGGGLKSLLALPEAFDEALTEAEKAPSVDGEPSVPMGPRLAALSGPTKPAGW